MNYNLSPQPYRPARTIIASVVAALCLPSLTSCASASRPHVVYDVPAQIDSKFSRNEYDPSNPPLWPTRYYFVMEQCPEDIDTYRRLGEVASPHFDPEINKHNQDCFVDSLLVSRQEYELYPAGTVLIFHER